MGRRLLFYAFILLLLWTSCDNTIDLYGPDVEKPVVWCLLDSRDSVHYLRLQRTFQSDGQNAFISAADPDRIYFPEETINVIVREIESGGASRSWVLDRVFGDTLDKIKVPGIFADSPNVLYRFRATLNPDAFYHLEVQREGRDSAYRADTELVQPFPVYYPGGPGTVVDYADTGTYVIQWVSARGGHLYDAQFEVHFREFHAGTWSTGSVRIPVFTNLARAESDGFEVMQSEVNNLVFYTGMRNSLTAAEPGSREFIQLDLLLSAGGQELYFLYLNNLSNLGISALFISSLYSNVSDGVGVFSSRSQTRVPAIHLTPATLDSLACGRFTRHLGFARPPALPGYPDCP